MAKVFLTLWFAVGYLMLSYTIQAQHNSDSTSSSSGSSPSSESDSSSSTSSRQATNSGGARKKTNITPRQTTPTVMNQPPQDQGPTMQFNEGLSKETLVLHCNQRNILASGNKKILIARLVAWQQGQQQQQQSPTQPNIGEPIQQDLPRNSPGDVTRPNKHTRTRKRRSKVGKSRYSHRRSLSRREKKFIRRHFTEQHKHPRARAIEAPQRYGSRSQYEFNESQQTVLPALDPRTLEKIKKSEYINFEQLLPQTSPSTGSERVFTLAFSEEFDQLSIRPEDTPRGGGSKPSTV